MSAASAFTDQELAVLLKQVGREAFTQIYHRFKGWLDAHAYNWLHDMEEWVNLLKELFSQLCGNRDAIQINTSLTTYLYGMGRNKFFKFIRHNAVGINISSSLKLSVEAGFYETDRLVSGQNLV